MKFQISELEHGLRLISLNGKMNGGGVYGVEVDFIRYYAVSKLRVLVDLSKVIEFIRTFACLSKRSDTPWHCPPGQVCAAPVR